MGQLIRMFVVLLFIKIMRQTVAHEQLVAPHIFFTLVAQCGNLSMLIFNGTVFIIGILIKITLNSPVLRVLTNIIDGFELNIAEIKHFTNICHSYPEVAIENARKFTKDKNNYNYDDINSVQHNSNPIDPTRVGIEDNKAISYDLKQCNWAASSLLTVFDVNKKLDNHIETVFWNVWSMPIIAITKRTNVSTEAACKIQFLSNQQGNGSVVLQNRAWLTV